MIPTTLLPPLADPNAIEVQANLTGDEQTQLDCLDADLEEIANKGSATFEVFVDPVATPLVVVAAIKARWEAGGWAVAVFRRENEQGEVLQIIFVRPPPSNQPARTFVPPTLPSLVSTGLTVHGDKEGSRLRMSRPLLLRMPTRGRPYQAIATVTAYRTLAADKSLPIEVVLDADDESMMDPCVLQQLVELDCMLCIDKHGNKVAAVNGGRQDDWQILALISDDMKPVVQGYDRIWIDKMHEHFPLLDGAIYFDDGYNSKNAGPAARGGLVLCTLPIIGRHFYEQFGYVYYPGYGSIYCDDEQTMLWSSMNRLRYVPQLVVEHLHPAAGKAPSDATYARNDNTFSNADRLLFLERRDKKRPGSQFTFDSPPLVLSILICTTPPRRHMLMRLVEFLRSQTRWWPRQVEILVNGDDVTTGTKRQQLLIESRGAYVAFVDDDDWVAHNYVDRIIDTLKLWPDADCVELHGVMTVDGGNPQRFHHSLQHERWETVDGVHLRYPNHLNPVKRELALAAGFPDRSLVEDRIYSDALRPMLKIEAPCGPEPLYHYWFRGRTSGGK